MIQKKMSKFTLLLWAAALAWVAVLFFFSGQNGTDSGELSLMVTQWILRIFPFIPLRLDTLHFLVRKAAHFSIFALEGMLLGGALMRTLRSRRMGALLAAVSCAVMAVANEFHQSFMEGRSCELRDMIIDSCGAVAGILFAALLIYLARRKKNVII